MLLVTVERVRLHSAECPPLTNIFKSTVRAGNDGIAMSSHHTRATSRAVAGLSGRYRGVDPTSSPPPCREGLEHGVSVCVTAAVDPLMGATVAASAVARRAVPPCAW